MRRARHDRSTTEKDAGTSLALLCPPHDHPSIPMTYFHPAWLEHQRKHFTRADAYRFAPPGTPAAKMPGWIDPSATRVRLKEAQEAEARRREAARQES